MKTWSAKELQAFLVSTREARFYPLRLLLASTGMRRGEALGLRWEDVGTENARLSGGHRCGQHCAPTCYITMKFCVGSALRDPGLYRLGHPAFGLLTRRSGHRTESSIEVTGQRSSCPTADRRTGIPIGVLGPHAGLGPLRNLGVGVESAGSGLALRL